MSDEILKIEKLENGTFDAQTMKAIVDARKWIASKLFPRQWGDKTTLVGGNPEDGDKPIQTLDLSTATPEQLATLAGLKLGGE